MIGDNKVIAIIPARGGSKGISKKNIKLLNGKPLIYYTIREAKKSKYIDIIAVSTDNFEIRNIVESHDIRIIDRPKKLATDKALIVPVLKHAINEIENSTDLGDCIVVLLQPTSPLRIYEDIDRVIEKINSGTDSAETFCALDHNPASYFKIVEKDAVPLDKKNLDTRRQDAPKIFRENGAVYGCRKNVLFNQNTLWSKKHKAVIMPKERSIDIDDEIDFKLAEFLIKNG